MSMNAGTVAVLVITDGRDDYLKMCVDSLVANVRGNITEWWMYDDTGDPAYRQRLQALYPPPWRHINAGPRQGFGGAIAHSWRTLLAESNAQWIFHVEQDFVFPEKINLNPMADVLAANPHLVQMALCRQAWNEREAAAGGVVEVNRDAYVQCSDPQGCAWLEHRLFWTTNPSLYSLDVCALRWPDGARSEGRFSHQLLSAGTRHVAPELVRFGYWGEYGRHVLVNHIGWERVGHGY